MNSRTIARAITSAFAAAVYAAASLLVGGCTPKSDYSWEKDLDYRNHCQYSWTRDDVRDYVSKIYPEVTEEQIDEWTENGVLESIQLDGQTMYFRRTAANLFRVDSTCKAAKALYEGKVANDSNSGQSGEGEEFDENAHLEAIIAEATETGKAVAQAVPLRIRYQIEVDADLVPDGEIVRCWLPFPREDLRRQRGVKLLATSQEKYRKADILAPHYSIYMEKKAVAGEPTIFWEEFEVTVCGEHNDLQFVKSAAYDRKSDLYKRYTCEQAPHIVFTDQMRELSAEITKGLRNPADKARAIFQWLNDNIPWAGANDYSLIPNIPEFVLEKKHGDCGQQTLLFMTLARIAGIPCQWESGLTVEPSGWNMHDWCNVYLEGIGWVPVDPSRGLTGLDGKLDWFFFGGTDSYRLIVNNAYGKPLQPRKWYPRSDTVDFQVGEVEWKGGNLYAYRQWHPSMEIEYLNK